MCNDYTTDIGEYDGYGFIDGLLVHNACLNISKNIIINFDNKKFFNIFKNNVEYRGHLPVNIDYQGIEKNLLLQMFVIVGTNY